MFSKQDMKDVILGIILGFFGGGIVLGMLLNWYFNHPKKRILVVIIICWFTFCVILWILIIYALIISFLV